jgi:hypothetical protein
MLLSMVTTFAKAPAGTDAAALVYITPCCVAAELRSQMRRLIGPQGWPTRSAAGLTVVGLLLRSDTPSGELRFTDRFATSQS